MIFLSACPEKSEPRIWHNYEICVLLSTHIIAVWCLAVIMVTGLALDWSTQYNWYMIRYMRSESSSITLGPLEVLGVSKARVQLVRYDQHRDILILEMQTPSPRTACGAGWMFSLGWRKGLLSLYYHCTITGHFFCMFPSNLPVEICVTMCFSEIIV